MLSLILSSLRPSLAARSGEFPVRRETESDGLTHGDPRIQLVAGQSEVPEIFLGPNGSVLGLEREDAGKEGRHEEGD
jgi:hypothetical protein